LLSNAATTFSYIFTQILAVDTDKYNTGICDIKVTRQRILVWVQVVRIGKEDVFSRFNNAVDEDTRANLGDASEWRALL
jgi:hypothetical protein